MDKTTFLKELENALEGEVSRAVINDTLNYYNQYIVDEVNKGQSEEEVIRKLGNGNVIAKTVIASQQAKEAESGYSGYDSRDYDSRAYNRPEEGLHMSMDDQGNVDISYGRFRLNSWYGKLLGILILVLVIALVVMIAAGLLSLLWTLLPIFLILFAIITIINYIMGR